MKIYKITNKISKIPTNLKELIRFLSLGKKLKLTYHANPNPKAQALVGQIREIISKKGDEIGIQTGNNISYLKLSDYNNLNTFQFLNNGFNILDTKNNKILMSYEYVEDQIPQTFDIQLPLSENTKQQFLETPKNEEYTIKMIDNLGGNSIINVKQNIPNIVSIHSMPFNTPAEEQDKFKRRGFYKLIIAALKELGFTTFKVNIQSLDSQKALARMLDTNLISNPRDFSGDSMAIKPHTFDIDKQPPRIPKDKWEEQDFKHWQEYKKNYLEKY